MTNFLEGVRLFNIPLGLVTLNPYYRKHNERKRESNA